MERWSVSPFGPPLQVRRGGLWAKHIGLKPGAVGNTLGEHIGNIWEQRKNEKNPPRTPPPKTQNFKRKQIKAL